MTVSNPLVIVREFDAPIEAVWKAWTTPEQIMLWWSPKTYTCSVAKIDLRVGGKVHFAMRGPDGKEIWSTGTYKEIVPMTKLVVTDSFSNEKGDIVSASEYGMQADFPKELLVTVELKDLGGKTKMTLTHAGMPEGEMKDMTGNGWNEMFDKLVETLK
jgi:uncharacterized protein YndB with AHSA1/START domain